MQKSSAKSRQSSADDESSASYSSKPSSATLPPTDSYISRSVSDEQASQFKQFYEEKLSKKSPNVSIGQPIDTLTPFLNFRSSSN